MKLSLRYKFLIVTVLLLFSAVSTYLFLAISLFNQDKTTYIYEGNATLVGAIAAEADANFQSIIKSMQLMGLTTNQKFASKDLWERALMELFNADDNLIELSILDGGGTADGLINRPKLLFRTVRSDFLKPYDLKPNYFEKVRQAHPIPMAQIAKGAILQNAAVADGIPLLALAIPYSSRRDKVFDQAIVAYLRQDRRMQLFSRTEMFTTYLLDSFGNILVHPNDKKILKQESLAGSNLFKDVLQVKFNTGVKEVKNDGEEAKIFAYSKLKTAGLIAISEIPRSKAYLASQKLIEKSVLFAVVIICVSFIVSLLFSRKITASLRRLYHASQKIANGDFTATVKVDSSDEVGALSTSFNTMAGEISRLMKETADKARIEKELETAHLVQENFFPIDHLEVGDFEVAAFYTPAGECGGDWWGHMLLGDQLVLLIGDATGHGVPSALITAAAQSCCATLESLKIDFAGLPLTPAKILEKLNNSIYRASRGQVKMTFVALSVDLNTGALTYANASHEQPLICRAPDKSNATAERSKKDIEVCMGKPGSILGAELNAKYEETNTALNAGDVICLYTDGLVECKNQQDEMYGKGKLLRSFYKDANSTAAEIKEKIVGKAMQHFGERQRDDDVTLVLLKRKASAKAARGPNPLQSVA